MNRGCVFSAGSSMRAQILRWCKILLDNKSDSDSDTMSENDEDVLHTTPKIFSLLSQKRIEITNIHI